jgi:hypothetical protein
MKYLRFATYMLLLVGIYLAARRGVSVIPVALQPPSYNQQAADALAAARIGDTWGSPFGVSGGLPEGQVWSHHEGPDFAVWTASYKLADAQVQVGVYLGGHPNVQPPPVGLSPGSVGGVPILWWKRVDESYRTIWDALIPRKDGAAQEYVHVWISSLHPKRVEEAAAMLRAVRFTP